MGPSCSAGTTVTSSSPATCWKKSSIPPVLATVLPAASSDLNTLVIKRGKYGAILFRRDNGHFIVPGYLLEEVFDPTGAGDCFAGGFVRSEYAGDQAR